MFIERTLALGWHTDFSSAQKEAKKRKLPILCLAMLGRLDEEMSCANSRLFRGVLYQDSKVRRAMRERFVLMWRCVRPVPIVTIDFGNGQRVTRPATGNSAHLVLTADGTVVDAIPGLYDEVSFVRALSQAFELFTSSDRRLLHIQRAQSPMSTAPARPATRAGELTMTKMMLEAPMLRLAEWPGPIAEETERNERNLHTRIHQQLARETYQLDAFIEWLYANVFELPLGDPWLGLGTDPTLHPHLPARTRTRT